MERNFRILGLVVTVMIIMYIIIATVWWSISGYLSHDENQFIVSTYLLMDQGLHPYRDFAYFHMPNLVYFFAPLFWFPSPFILARLITALSGIGICLLVFFYARSFLDQDNRIGFLVIPACFVLLIVHSPSYILAVSHIWNHAPSVFFALAAVILLISGLKNNQQGSRYFFYSGISLGMAIGIRLTLAPLALPFITMILIFQSVPARRKSSQLLLFGIGGLIMNIPAIYFMITCFQDFWFGNITYAGLNTLYRKEMIYPEAMTLVGKFIYMATKILTKPAELAVYLVSGIGLAAWMVGKFKEPKRSGPEMNFFLLLLPFVMAGCLAPTPSWPTYFFALVPFILLIGLAGFKFRPARKFSIAMTAVLILITLASTLISSPLKRNQIPGAFSHPGRLGIVKLRKESEFIARHIRITEEARGMLTLAPLYAVDINVPVFGEFVTGPFAWRVSHLVPEDEALKFKLPLQHKIMEYIIDKKPAAILTGREPKELEDPICNAAARLGYNPVKTPTGMVLWVKQ